MISLQAFEPSAKSGRAVYDILIHTPRSNVPASVVEAFPQPNLPISLGKDIVVDRLDDKVTEKLFQALDPPGIHPANAFRTLEYWQLYSFVRRIGGAGDPLTGSWDSDQALRTCLALSRLVHPTTVAFRFAARVVTLPDGSIEWVHPGMAVGHGAAAFVSTDENRDWLTNQEFDIVRDLLSDFDASKWPRRLVRSLWYHDYASLTYELDVRWVLMTTALEALVHTDRYNSGKQFRVRVKQLASATGVTCTEDEIELAYDQRSQLAHGQHFVSLSGIPPNTGEKVELSPEVTASYRKVEEILRTSLLKAAAEGHFASVFADDNSIRTHLPI
jgi:hypothetical protein